MSLDGYLILGPFILMQILHSFSNRLLDFNNITLNWRKSQNKNKIALVSVPLKQRLYYKIYCYSHTHECVKFNSLHITFPSFISKPILETVPHTPLLQYSTLPSILLGPSGPTRRVVPVVQLSKSNHNFLCQSRNELNTYY